MVERRDVELGVDGGDRLRGWLFLPSKRAGPLPAISVAHGYAGVREYGLERFARDRGSAKLRRRRLIAEMIRGLVNL